MKKQILILASCMALVSCGSTNTNSEIQYEFPQCGTSLLNGKVIPKVCATYDFTAPRTYKDYTPKFIKIIFGAGHAGYGSSTSKVGAVLGFENQELDMQKHIWDFSKQNSPELRLRGHDSVIRNGIILNTDIILGYDYYSLPNFLIGEQRGNTGIEKTRNPEILNYGFLYADNYFECKKATYNKCENKAIENKFENFSIENLNIKSKEISLYSWGGRISNTKIIIENYLIIGGSKAKISSNLIISKTSLEKIKSILGLNKINKSGLVDYSSLIFPFQEENQTTIPSALYVKFSPNTVIDGNTFSLTQKNDQAYAIVLDHSPRVRITNNTFNGFKVPILMDQWSSIVDEKGNEIKPENFKGYGNVINANKFAGNVTMNRKGEIVLK